LIIFFPYPQPFSDTELAENFLKKSSSFPNNQIFLSILQCLYSLISDFNPGHFNPSQKRLQWIPQYPNLTYSKNIDNWLLLINDDITKWILLNNFEISKSPFPQS